MYPTDKEFLIKYLTSKNPQNSKIWYLVIAAQPEKRFLKDLEGKLDA